MYRKGFPVKPHATTRPRACSVLAALALAGVTLPLASCNIVGPAGYFIAGPEKIPAAYELDRTKTTVVFIDDTRGSVLPTKSIKRRIGEAAENILLNEAKIERMIASQDLIAIADREKFSKEFGIVELGEAVNADVVVYVAMESFAVMQDQENYTPTASARVRVIDVRSKTQLWPEKLDEAYNLSVVAPSRAGAPPRNTSERTQVQTEFAERVGRSIAWIFVEHHKNPQGGRLDR